LTNRLTLALVLTILTARQPGSLGAAQRPQASEPPVKLVLLIAVDQFRYDYLTRFEAEYKAGFKQLLTQGAVFTNANLEHYPTVTAVGRPERGRPPLATCDEAQPRATRPRRRWRTLSTCHDP